MHNPMYDERGHVWFTSRVGPPANPDWCKKGSDHPSAKLFPMESAARHLSRYDPKTGDLTPLAVVQSVSPSFLAVSPNRRVLVAVNESRRYNGILNSGSVSSFSIDPVSGDLAPVNVVPSRGADPAHLSFDRTGKWLFVANYGGGSIAVFPVAEDGTLSDAVHIVEHQGASNTNPVRQEAPHVHSVDISPDNRFLYVADLGKDEIAVYNFDANLRLRTRGDKKY
mgnify:CR=1 FL=1